MEDEKHLLLDCGIYDEIREDTRVAYGKLAAQSRLFTVISGEQKERKLSNTITEIILNYYDDDPKKTLREVGKSILERKGLVLLMGGGEEDENNIAIRHLKRTLGRRKRLLSVKEEGN